MVISNNQDSHDDDKGGDDGDPNDDADADDTIIFLSPWPPVATHPPLLARHWAICDEFIDYRAYHDHHDYHLLSYLYVICVIRCLIECDSLYSVPWPVHMHCHHPILSYSLSSKLLSSPILDNHQIITNDPLHSVPWPVHIHRHYPSHILIRMFCILKVAVVIKSSQIHLSERSWLAEKTVPCSVIAKHWEQRLYHPWLK